MTAGRTDARDPGTNRMLGRYEQSAPSVDGLPGRRFGTVVGLPGRLSPLERLLEGVVGRQSRRVNVCLVGSPAAVLDDHHGVAAVGVRRGVPRDRGA